MGLLEGIIYIVFSPSRWTVHKVCVYCIVIVEHVCYFQVLMRWLQIWAVCEAEWYCATEMCSVEPKMSERIDTVAKQNSEKLQIKTWKWSEQRADFQPLEKYTLFQNACFVKETLTRWCTPKCLFWNYSCPLEKVDSFRFSHYSTTKLKLKASIIRLKYLGEGLSNPNRRKEETESVRLGWNSDAVNQ